jgi:hypothetical protein
MPLKDTLQNLKQTQQMIPAEQIANWQKAVIELFKIVRANLTTYIHTGLLDIKQRPVTRVERLCRFRLLSPY